MNDDDNLSPSNAYGQFVESRVPVVIDSEMLDRLLSILFAQNSAIHQLVLAHLGDINASTKAVYDARSTASKSLEILNTVLDQVKAEAAAQARKGNR